MTGTPEKETESRYVVVGNRLRPKDALREPAFVRLEACHMEGAPPGSACACPGLCMGVYEITGDRLEWERREAVSKAIGQIFAEIRESATDLSHPSVMRRWLREREAQMRKELP